MNLTLTLPVELWVMAALAVIIGGKILQQGGIAYAKGEYWEIETLIGALLELAAIGGIGFALLIQNVGPQ